ncbi:hypothetical protein BGW80DRAFT_670926 [Lactifluus volemus]|nr:hypothetical protein BGW80DRAFT_670926 [Lactifluus volemus]
MPWLWSFRAFFPQVASFVLCLQVAMTLSQLMIGFRTPPARFRMLSEHGPHSPPYRKLLGYAHRLPRELLAEHRNNVTVKVSLKDCRSQLWLHGDYPVRTIQA